MLRRISTRSLPFGRRGFAMNLGPSGLQNDAELTSTLQRIKKDLAEDKNRLRWRQPIGDRPEHWNSKFKAFADKDQNADFIVMMQQPFDLSPKAIARWWAKRKRFIEISLQQYMPERHKILGPELAAAHFLLYRGGAVKFVGDSEWRRAKEDEEIDLPSKYDPGYKVEALRCDEMKLYYEGLENLRSLLHLKFLSFHKVELFDDWCLDRISGSDYPRLEVLDISGTSCTSNGLCCLYRLPSLKLLIVNDPKETLQYELTCAMLEEALPKLKVVGAASVHNL